MPRVVEPVHCPDCKAAEVVQHGQAAAGKQRYKCCHPACSRHRLLLTYTDQGWLPSVPQQISDMAMHGRGLRETARTLHISTTTVMDELKQGPSTGTRSSTLNGTTATNRCGDG